MSTPAKIHISELLDPIQLEKDIADGMIKRSHHSELPIEILCYTHLTQFKQYWTAETMVCRGLIIDEEGYVIARGPGKFFNYGQPGAPKFSLDDLCYVTDKLDGSLGVYWRYNGHDGIATKGSFNSPQALKATELLDSSDEGEYYRDQWDEGMLRWATPIFEIIYPEGRIVLDYGAEESIRPLGTVLLDTGIIRRQITSDIILKRNITVAEALAIPPRHNAEGLVLDVFSQDGTVHLKIKQEDYKRLHAIVTGTSARSLWVYQVADLFKDVPYIKEDPKHWGSVFFYDVKAFVDAAEQDDWKARLFDTVPDEFENWVHRTLQEHYIKAGDKITDAFKFAEDIRHLEGQDLWLKAQSHPYVTEIIRYIRHGDATGIQMKAWADIQPFGVSLPPFSDMEP